MITVGDSITVGGGEPKWGFLADDSWVAHVVAAGAAPYGFDASVRGQTTEMLLQGLPTVLRRRPRVVVVTTGTNDRTADVTVALVAIIVERVREVSAQPVLATVPPCREKAEQIARLNDGLRRLADARCLELIDFHGVLADEDHFKPGLSEDEKHPNVQAARLMAESAATVLRRLFSPADG